MMANYLKLFLNVNTKELFSLRRGRGGGSFSEAQNTLAGQAQKAIFKIEYIFI